MHEAAIARNILESLRRRLPDLPAGSQFADVEVCVGQFRNVDPESLQFAFDGLRPLYASCEQCALKIHILQAKARCAGGDHLYQPRFEDGFRCTECGGGIKTLEEGEELQITGYSLTSKEKKEAHHA
jgi:Zn finger protein HypA/HybF involved in hydrogenase expression